MNKLLKSRVTKLEGANASRRVLYKVSPWPLGDDPPPDDKPYRPLTREEWIAKYCREDWRSVAGR